MRGSEAWTRGRGPNTTRRNCCDVGALGCAFSSQMSSAAGGDSRWGRRALDELVSASFVVSGPPGMPRSLARTVHYPDLVWRRCLGRPASLRRTIPKTKARQRVSVLKTA
jgi:hypothetical protein